MDYYLGVDSSTTATKALLIDGLGDVVAVASTEYSFDTPRPLWSEQQPFLWWDGAKTSIRQVLFDADVDGSAVKSVGLTGQMHGLVLLGDADNVLRPAILWNDQRTATECDEIRSLIGKEKFIQLTGNDALTGFTAPKILWVKNHEPEVYAQIRHILLPKDYVRFRLTGEYASDRAGGSGTVLFDLKERDWSSEVVRALEIDPDWLPKTFEGPEVTGGITQEAADATGLNPGTPVVAGGGDQAAQAVGVGAVTPEIAALTLGTSGVVFASVDEPIIEPEGRLHAFCHAVPGKWHLMGVMLSAAGSLRWFRETFAKGIGYDELLDPVSGIPIGSEGLLFLPYLTGERTPHPDPHARGAFVGLTVRHTRHHLARAVLEGVAFGLRDSFELMEQVGLPNIEQVRVSGGGAKSVLWRQILADILQVELVTVNTTEGAAFGAAVLGAVGVGVFSDVHVACESAIRVTGTITPTRGQNTYQKLYALYRDLYPSLRSTFNELTEIVS